jgi:hypothetical protein
MSADASTGFDTAPPAVDGSAIAVPDHGKRSHGRHRSPDAESRPRSATQGVVRGGRTRRWPERRPPGFYGRS